MKRSELGRSDEFNMRHIWEKRKSDWVTFDIFSETN